MAAPNITLESPYILVSLSASPNGIIPYRKGFQIGYVEVVNQITDNITVGTFLMFNNEANEAFLYGSTVYYRIKEEHILFKENPPL